MKPVEIYEYFSFGYNFNILLWDRHESTNNECYLDLKRLIDFIEMLDLKVSRSSVDLNNLDVDLESLKKLTASDETKSLQVNPDLWNKIVEKLKKFDNVLDAELKIKLAYILDEKRFSNEILLDEIHKLFSPNTFFKLPHIAQYDFTESGKCLAFDRYTACAFHALRGTEDVIKLYYQKALGLSDNDKNTWGTYETAIVTAISDKTLNPPPEEQLVINIISLRKYYRNKTQHPQNTYSSDEAQDLFSLCIKTINELISDLTKRKLI